MQHPGKSPLGDLGVKGDLGVNDKVDSLIQNGIKYYDRQLYSYALEEFNKALQLDPQSIQANYEMASTYIQIKDYRQAIRYADVIIQTNSQYSFMGYNLKGTSLNQLGQIDDAIDSFWEGIDHNEDFYLLHYNLGIAYLQKNDALSAESCFKKSIELNPQHAGSHFQLSLSLINLNLRVESMLSLYYFLLLEPETERARDALSMLEKLLYSGIEIDRENSLSFQPISEFAAIDSLLSSQNNHTPTGDSAFFSLTRYFFSELASYQVNYNTSGNIWFSFYIPLFTELADQELLNVFCHVIRISTYKTSVSWLQEHQKEVDRLDSFLEAFKYY